MSELRSLGLGQKLTRIEHHTSHAAVAYLTSGFENVLALTLDWYGGGLSGSVNRCTPKGIERLHNYHYPHSLGLFYAQVTQALGFKSSRHEGKIVGLAAHGDPTLLGPLLLQRFRHKEGDFWYHCAMDGQFAKDLAVRYPREHVAAGFQYVLEVIVCEIVTYWMRRTGLHDIVLAGGVTANVKLNQAIAELDEIRQVFIHPNMGDGGTGVGATLAHLLECGEVKSHEWKTCDIGPKFSERNMRDALQQQGLTPIRSKNMSKDVAKLLAEGKVVALFRGAMEYGPRALGNRSILCAATDATINQWLNQKLGRTEFMPFAPVTLFERIGVTANVKLNQAIAELDEIRQVFIHPNMGDGGTGVGATLAHLLECGEVKSHEWKTCDIGPKFSERNMRDALQQQGLTPIRSKNMSKDVAKLLAEGKVVALFRGAMEYGPRALGNRSILCAATDATINQWLNQKLGRTEFMPFAPVTLFEHSPDRYHRLETSFAATRFMTITCDCTDLMQQESPAAVHVDGTARPQIIRREDNPEYYAILQEYHHLTGIPTLINTSFNMHEDPIVCTPQDAVQAFMIGNLDYLSLGPFLVSSKPTNMADHAHVDEQVGSIHES